MAIKILSLDGGGIRGIIPAMILAEIEGRTKRPIRERERGWAGCASS